VATGKMMMWTIIAPELILAWAVRQWFSAWEIRDAVNGLDECRTMVRVMGSAPSAHHLKMMIW